MKIMFCTATMGKGGAERVISILSNAMIKKNEVSIIVNTKKNIAYNLDNKIDVIELDKKHYKNSILKYISRIIRTKSILKKERPDIIISFLPVPSFTVLAWKKKLKIPVIVSDRNDPNEEYKSLLFKMMMKILYKRADGFVFQTKQQREFFPEIIRNKSTIIFNPIKNEFLKKDERIKENTIINVGRLVEQKNQKMLITAFSKITEIYKDYTLKIFGDGPLKAELENQIEELGMQDKIKLCGISNNIKKELEKAKVFVLSSNYEGMPNALIEAMAVGLPVISTECPCGGPKELIRNQENGILIPVKDDNKLEKKLEEILSNDDYARKLGDNAQKIVKQLKEDKIIQKWKEYINKIILNTN